MKIFILISIMSLCYSCTFQQKKTKKSFTTFKKFIDNNQFSEFKKKYSALKKDTFFNDDSFNKESILLYALESYKTNFAKFIINQNKCNLNYQNSNGITALHKAVLLPKADCVLELLNSGKISLKSKIYKDILRQSFLKRYTPTKTIQLLLENGCQKNENDSFGPIYSAVIFGQCDKIDLLLKYNFQVRSEYGEEGNILNVAKKYDCKCIRDNELGVRDKLKNISITSNSKN